MTDGKTAGPEASAQREARSEHIPTPEGRGGEDGLTLHLTDAQRAKLVALEKAATPAPWRAMMQGNSRLLDGTHVGQARLEPVPRPYEPRWVGFQNEATALEWHHSTVMREEDAELVAMMRNLLPTLLSSPRVEEDAKLREIHAFLLGEGPLDGRWFGDEPPVVGKLRRPYWWRNNLRAALSPPVG